jgi:cation:H+ antiporter
LNIAIEVVAGLVLLAIGGEGVVRGAVGAARRLGVSELLIGLTLVGFGTSTPELITSINAALHGSPGLAVGNVVGSNISNALLIAAVAALCAPILVARKTLLRDGGPMIAAAVGLAAYAFFFHRIERWAGAAMLGLLCVYLWSTWRHERAESAANPPPADANPAPVTGNLLFSLLIAGGSIALMVFGADLLVRGAIGLARFAGLSETVIGLTVVAVGTSLPELVASLAAALRGRSGVAFGNVVGSNIYNVLGVLGVTAIVKPTPLPPDLGPVDWSVFVASAVMLVFHAWTGSRISRSEGALMLALYVAYTIYLVRAAL